MVARGQCKLQQPFSSGKQLCSTHDVCFLVRRCAIHNAHDAVAIVCISPVVFATDGTYTTVVAVAVSMSPKESAPATPKPVSTDPNDNVPGMPTDIRRRPFLSTPALKDMEDVLADTNSISATAGSSKEARAVNPQLACAHWMRGPALGAALQLSELSCGSVSAAASSAHEAAPAQLGGRCNTCAAEC